MKRSHVITIIGWCLLTITGLSGLGITHLFEHSFAPLTHATLSAVGQILPLAGLFGLSLSLQKRARAARVSPSPRIDERVTQP